MPVALIDAPHWWTDKVPLMQQSTFPRLATALVLGICIGAERQWRQRAAGLRTNTLVCLGAAAFVDLGLTIAPGTTQVMAYVVSGVGFLGAGAIMKDGGNVRGLNTAATLWCSAAVGACAGSGELVDAVFVAMLLVTVNSLLRPLSRFIDRRSLARVQPQTLYRLRVVCDTVKADEAERQLTDFIAYYSLKLREMKSETIKDTDTSLLQAVVEAAAKDDSVMDELLAAIRKRPWVESADSTIAETEIE